MLKLKVLILTTLVALAATTASAQQHLYKCKDGKGRTYYTQTPPKECLGKELDEISKQGTVLKRREAPLTQEQIDARDAEEKRKKEEALLAKEEERKNRALLTTYSSEKDIEDGRQRALMQSKQSEKDIEKRVAEAKERAKKLAEEKEFYAKKPMPKKLQDDIKNNDMDLRVQEESLGAKQKEVSEINAKYDEDKRRYLELTGARPRAAAPKK